MTTPGVCLSIGELSDYWTADVSPDDMERIEAHVFACTACTELLAEADELRRSIRDLARNGGFQAFVTDSLLNQLASDGVRVRSFAMDPGGSVRCAVWTMTTFSSLDCVRTSAVSARSTPSCSSRTARSGRARRTWPCAKVAVN